MKNLKKFNFIMGMFHLVQGLIMLFIYFNVEKVANFKPTIYSYFLKYDFDSMRLVTDVRELFDLPFVLFVSMFLFLSALFHFIIVICYKKYSSDLSKNINQFRWYEYALSSSLMIVLIAVLFGVYNIASLILIFGLNAVMNLFGLLMEKMNMSKDEFDWTPFAFGSVAGIIPWIVVIVYAFGKSDPAQV